jgi:predicted amidohydrolase
MGADIILSPCAWAVPSDHDNSATPYGGLWVDSYSPVAREFRVWIAAASNVGPITSGPWRGRKCIGCSMVFSPDGKQILSGRHGEDADEILFAEIAGGLRPARGCGWEDFNPA